MADLSCMHASTQHKGIVACITPGQKLTHGSNPHERRGVNLTQSCTKNFLRQRFVTHFTVVDDNTMALSNVWFTLAAVLVVIASPAKANNNDVFNFALNLECLEVSCSHGLLCGVLGRLFCAYVRTLLKVTETVFVRCTDFDVIHFKRFCLLHRGNFTATQHTVNFQTHCCSLAGLLPREEKRQILALQCKPLQLSLPGMRSLM